MSNSEWTKGYMNRKPDEFAKGGKEKWIQRRNIQENVGKRQGMDDEGNEIEEEYIYYTFEERFISESEYQKLASQRLYENSEKNFKKVINSQDTVIENQEVSNNSQLAIMEAMADLYEIVVPE